MPWLINAGQLEKFRKSQKNIIVLDASWHLPEDNQNPSEAFLKRHIVGAKFFDLTLFNDPENPLPNMITRNEAVIAEKLGELGITNEHKIIFYDQSKLHTSCRALWMLKIFGHNPNQLYILDGGFAAWERYAGKVESGEPKQTSSKKYVVNFEAHYLRTLMQMKTNLHHPMEQVIDLRHPVRFAGGKEHRAGLRSGHIPGSFSFPYTTMFEANETFKPLEKIRKQLSGLGIDLASPLVTTCGSGITSCILNFVLDLLNNDKHALYDGSWSEWGAQEIYPGEESLSERPVIRSIDQ
ncbi:MAG: sulfurtransferase [Gammaproteobacteria bacterium]|nr:sulfurtransferase [Gammaproteobacteria bacterium]